MAKKKVESKTFKVWVVWGADSTIRDNPDCKPSCYSFKTEAEQNAFMEGVDAATGWMESSVHFTEEQALEAIAEIIAEDEYAEEEEAFRRDEKNGLYGGKEDVAN